MCLNRALADRGEEEKQEEEREGEKVREGIKWKSEIELEEAGEGVRRQRYV